MVGFAGSGLCAERSFEQTHSTQSPSPSWVATGSLINARTGHTATLLQNGKVLVAGGYGASDVRLDSAELYDPATGTWTMTGHLNAPRWDHTATLLTNGQVLVAGGVTSAAPPDFGRTGTAELYDPATEVWTPTADMGTTRSWHTATLLNNGKVLVAGGFSSDTLGSAELYDPVSRTWSWTGNFTPRYGHTATLLEDGRVLAAGGSNDGDLNSTLDTVETYDPAAGAWSAAPSLTVPEISHTATLLKNGEMLIAGGYLPQWVQSAVPQYSFVASATSLNTALLYDPAAVKWSSTGLLNAPRDAHTATLMPDGRVLIVGGETFQGQYPDTQHQTLGSAEIYDPVAGGWTWTNGLNTARSRHTATRLADGRVLVAGGQSDGPDPLASAELYGDAGVRPGAIGPGYTGSWYDPAQSGHGLLIEVLSDNRFLAAWFGFNPAGTQQAWFAGIGTYSGDTATVTGVVQPSGGRWIPNFDPNSIVLNPWGTLTFTFTDCNHGRVDFNSVNGYGTGSMNLTRLTQPAGLTCQ
jgi:N-acetylneuraminic acid mutarotase